MDIRNKDQKRKSLSTKKVGDNSTKDKNLGKGKKNQKTRKT